MKPILELEKSQEKNKEIYYDFEFKNYLGKK